LDKHRCLAYFWPHTGRYRDWRFSVRGKQITMAPKGFLNFNNTESLLDAAVAGHGVIMVSTFVAAHAVRTGKLQVLLKQYTGPGTDVFAVSMPHMATTARVKAFLRFLQGVVPSDPLWDQIVK
jgi:LysR family transcriptional regulator, regulator for bpeEF and oprC